MKTTVTLTNLFLVVVLVLLNLFAPGPVAYGAVSNSVNNAPSTQAPLSLAMPTLGPVGTVVAWGMNWCGQVNVPAEVGLGEVGLA